MRVSKIGAVVGTMITNPLTVIFIYPFQCWLGNLLLGHPLSADTVASAALAFAGNADAGTAASSGNSFTGYFAGLWHGISSLGLPLISAFFVGGAVMALFLTPLTYFTVFRLVTAYRRLIEKRRERRRLRRAESAGQFK